MYEPYKAWWNSASSIYICVEVKKHWKDNMSMVNQDDTRPLLEHRLMRFYKEMPWEQTLGSFYPTRVISASKSSKGKASGGRPPPMRELCASVFLSLWFSGCSVRTNDLGSSPNTCWSPFSFSLITGKVSHWLRDLGGQLHLARI